MTTNLTIETHRNGCTGNGFRYAATVRSTKESLANATAGKVLLICKDHTCSARRYV